MAYPMYEMDYATELPSFPMVFEDPMDAFMTPVPSPEPVSRESPEMAPRSRPKDKRCPVYVRSHPCTASRARCGVVAVVLEGAKHDRDRPSNPKNFLAQLSSYKAQADPPSPGPVTTRYSCRFQPAPAKPEPVRVVREDWFGAED
jgi:hypothetical protein